MIDFDLPPLDWRECRIPKPNKPGEYRKLTIPNDTLKKVQRLILEYLYTVPELPVAIFAHGFYPHRSIITNVCRHDKDFDVILGMDVHSFFDTFPTSVVKDCLLKAHIGEHLVDKIMTVCTYKDTLPQGSPTSPHLTNIGMFETDLIISAFAKRNGFTYTRYADDLVFSINYAKQGNEPSTGYKFMFKGIEKILSARLGLHLNEAKSHIIRKHNKVKRRVTGVVIRADALGYNAPRQKRNITRARLCNLARKVQKNHGVVTAEDYKEWASIVGYMRYADNVRAASDEGSVAAGADPRFQEKFYNYLKDKFV